MSWKRVILVWLSAVSVALADDPFADVVPIIQEVPDVPPVPWWKENVLFRKEVYFLVAGDDQGFRDGGPLYSRVSAGFELQKRFASATRTVALIDVQGRLVYRDHPVDTAADPMAASADQWTYETHNAYVDFLNLFGSPGRFNVRAGRYYVPFGLNTQTDTHGSLLQLSNQRIFGEKHDWQVSAYGNASESLDYILGYVLGAGPNQKLDGQTGLFSGRLGLGKSLLFKHGVEGGLSAAAGERLDPQSGIEGPIQTWRGGVDVRKRFDSGIGPLTLTGEATTGEDDDAPVWSGLAQTDWLHPGRRWGAAAQYFYFERGAETDGDEAIDERASVVLTRYFRNDIGRSSLHWVALALEQRIRTPSDEQGALLEVQYYRYW